MLSGTGARVKPHRGVPSIIDTRAITSEHASRLFANRYLVERMRVG
jgi:hypothetical protein